MAAIAGASAVNAAANADDLDRLIRDLWREYANGSIPESDMEVLDALIRNRRPPRISRRQPITSRFKSRQHPRSPDRAASRARRRMLGGSGALPARLRELLTEGQRSVAAILVGEIKHRGVCDLPIDKIAALAGVCRTSVQTALHELRRLGLVKITERPQPGRKHLTNIIAIVSTEWLAWIRIAVASHKPGIGSNSLSPFKMASPTKIIDSKPSEVSDLPARRAPPASRSGREQG